MRRRTATIEVRNYGATLSSGLRYRLSACSHSIGTPGDGLPAAEEDDDPSNDCGSIEFEVREPTNLGDCGIASVTSPAAIVAGSGESFTVTRENRSSYEIFCITRTELRRLDADGNVDLTGGAALYGYGSLDPGQVASHEVVADDWRAYESSSWGLEPGERYRIVACSYSLGPFDALPEIDREVDEDESNRCRETEFDYTE